MKCGFEYGACERSYVGKTKGGHRACQFHLDRYEREQMFDLVEKALNDGITLKSSMQELYQFIDEYIIISEKKHSQGDINEVE